jgi:hypothetical protein
MSVKNRLAAIVAVPAGCVWAFDHFIANMPMVMEGGMVVAGMAVAAVGVEGCRKLLHSVTADKPAEQVAQEAPAQEAPAQEAPAQVAPEATFPAPMTVQALPVASPREDLLRAYQMGAAAAQNVQRIER